ncbi:hypothetical protein [Streptomyces sp. NPDC046909]|uniref:hypothetical protein n=1 Tax=Streptomyces sp. NPDC046909 TaxID=3155617 RepID=UPI0033DBCCBB
MNRYVVAEDLDLVIAGKVRRPTNVFWNRLEGRPRRDDFSRALRAELRDPLWLLTRQWQTGEFIGEDAGSPVTAKLAWTTDQVSQVRDPEGHTAGYDGSQPLEAVVEARPLDLTRNGRPHDARLGAQLGRRWERMLTAAGLGAHLAFYRTTYEFVRPDPDRKEQYELTASASTWQFLDALAGRLTDGGALYAHLKDAGRASDGLGLTGAAADQVDGIGDQLVSWVDRTFYQSEDGLENWLPGHLEYGLGLNAPVGAEGASLRAPEYHGGRLDWYHFDAGGEAMDPGPSPAELRATSFLPTPVQFDGMPNTRHWAFEEGLVNFGDIKPDTTDIAKLLLIEFGVVFATDWFLLPIELPVGSLTSIRGLVVTNVFGDRTWIEPAVDPAGPVRSWQMYRLSDKGRRDGRLFLPATTPTGLESEPVESVDLIRDEVSNMVWAIEQTVQLADGSSRRGREVALEVHARFQAGVAPTPPPTPLSNDAGLAYVLMTSVPENWIPFIPVHVPDDNREIQLQRASMPRLLEGTQGVLPEKVKPVTRLVREGLDWPVPTGYLLAEEEVSRAGVRLESRWQRCRWLDGRVVTWFGYRRRTGAGGEGSSGLGFDQLVPKAPS